VWKVSQNLMIHHGALKIQDRKMQDWKMRDQWCRKRRTKSQYWKMRD